LIWHRAMRSDRFLNIQLAYIRELYAQLPDDLDRSLCAKREDDIFHFKAFGQPCTITPEGIYLSGELITEDMGITIALYARYASNDEVRLLPSKALAQIEGSQPLEDYFRAQSEQSLVPYVDDIKKSMDRIIQVFGGSHNKDENAGDFSFTLFPLPKVPLYYVVYLADDEFPASVTCLFAANAESFMPVDALADVGEHTAKKIIEMISTWQFV
jgi:hypothetical protein